MRNATGDQRRAGRAQGNGDDPLRDVADGLRHLCESAGLYARAKQDYLRLALWDAVWRLMARVATIGVVAGCFLIAAAYVFDGAARGLAIALGGRAWLASVVTGFSGLFIFGGVVFVGRRVTRAAAHRGRVADYEARKARQRERNCPPAAEPDRDAQRPTVSPGTNGHGTGRRALRPAGPARRAPGDP